MAYRYCPDCGRWLETSEYTVDEIGETVCPEHRAVHGYIDGSIKVATRLVHELSSALGRQDYQSAEVEAAIEQGLVWDDRPVHKTA